MFIYWPENCSCVHNASSLTPKNISLFCSLTFQVVWVFLMNKACEVTTIIKNHVKRLSIPEHQSLLYTPDILFISFSFPCVNRYASLGYGSSSMVLSGEDVAWWPLNLLGRLYKYYLTQDRTIMAKSSLSSLGQNQYASLRRTQSFRISVIVILIK